MVKKIKDNDIIDRVTISKSEVKNKIYDYLSDTIGKPVQVNLSYKKDDKHIYEKIYGFNEKEKGSKFSSNAHSFINYILSDFINSKKYTDIEVFVNDYSKCKLYFYTSRGFMSKINETFEELVIEDNKIREYKDIQNSVKEIIFEPKRKIAEEVVNKTA